MLRLAQCGPESLLLVGGVGPMVKVVVGEPVRVPADHVLHVTDLFIGRREPGPQWALALVLADFLEPFAALAPLLFALASARDPRVATALLVPVSLALYLPYSVLVVMGQEYLPNRVGTASGVTLGLAVTAGGLAAPLLGLVADRWGLAAPLLAVSALPLLAVALALTLPDSRAAEERA